MNSIILYHVFIWLLRYQEVFSFTIAELATSCQPSLKYWRSELVKALVAAEVDEKFCTKLLCQYSQYTEIGELLAPVLSLYIRTRRPDCLRLDIPEHVACPDQLRLLLGEVRLYHEGGFELFLHHSYFNYVPCDDVITALAGHRWDIIPDILAHIDSLVTWHLPAVVDAMCWHLVKKL